MGGIPYMKGFRITVLLLASMGLSGNNGLKEPP